MRGFIVVAVSSTGPDRCWDLEDDPGNVRQAIEHVKQTEGLIKEAPVIALGVGDNDGGSVLTDNGGGGQLVALLAGRDASKVVENLMCIVPMNAGLGMYRVYNRGVPTLFVH